MRKALLIVGAAALATSMPALAKPGGNGGGKPEKHHGGGGGHGGSGGGNPHKSEARGHGGGGHGGGKAHTFEARGGGGNGGEFRHQRKAERAFAREERGGGWAKPNRNEKRWDRAERKEQRRWARAERKPEKNDFAKADKKAWKAEAKRQERFVRAERRPDVRQVRYDDRRLDGSRERYEGPRERYGDRRYAADGYAGNCPPGLAKKGNGCLPPGQAKKLLGVGQALPAAYYGSYNVPYQYQDWYQDTSEHRYRYDDSGYIYQVDNQSGLIESLIPLLGGGFGIGQLLPAGYDAYNLPMSYRDDYQDSGDALYRYGDDAIYQVDPQTNMIESIVALLAGDLNVGQQLPSGYDAYNLPMEYRDEYVDDPDSMYRYADGNIYEVDPKSMIIEQIVAQLT